MTESTTNVPAGVQLTSAGDLLETIPYLLGFHPSDSLVLLGVREDRIAVTARLDLVDCCADDCLGVIDSAFRAMIGSGSQAVLVVVYDDGRSRAEFIETQLLSLVLDSAVSAELILAEALLVRSRRWWRYPDVGTGWPGEPLPGDASVAAATATFAGLVAVQDRATLTAVLDGASAADRERLESVLAGFENSAMQALLDGQQQRHLRSVKRAIFAEAREADATLLSVDPTGSRDSLLCRLAVGLSNIAVRDAVWLAVDQGRLDGRALWLEMLRTLPKPYDCAALFLYGWASWRAGEGVLAVEAALRALESDPAYTAADLLLSAVQNGLDPYRTPRLRMPRSP